MRRARLLSLAVLMLVPAAAWPQGNPVGPEFRVNTYTPGNEFGSSIAADALGNFVVVWQSSSQDGSLTGIFGQRYASSGAPLGPEFRVNTYTTSNQFGPAVASDASGNLVVVWVSQLQDGSAFGIFGQRFAASGAPIGAEFRINTYTTGDQSGPEMDADGAGNFVVVWQSAAQDGSGLGVFGQRFAASGATAGAEFGVNTNTALDQSRQAIGLDASGNFVVVWQSAGQDGAGNGVFGQRYAAAGTPLGAEFRVNTYVTNDQTGPAVAADNAGDFVVVWTSSGQDGSNYGVFGQRYGQIFPVELMHFRVE
jgi:hypothetical protein